MASKSISKSVMWQLLGKLSLQGISFFTIPVFTRILTPEDYGYTALYSSWSSILSLVIGMQTSGSIGNARINKDIKIQEYLSSIMSISILSFLPFFILSILFNNFFAQYLSIRRDLVILLVFQSFFNYVISFQISKFDVYKQVEKSTLLSFFQTLLSVSLSLLFVLYMKNDKAIGKIYGHAIPVILFGFFICVIVYIRGKVLWNSSYNRFCLSFSVPLILHGIGHLIFTQCDKIMLQKLQNTEVLGIYSIACTLSNVLVIIMGALNTSWVPFYYDYKSKNDVDSILIHTKQYLKLFTIITMGFILMVFEVFKIMTPEEYHSGLLLLPIFALSSYFHFLYLFPVNNEFYYAKTNYIPIATIIAAVSNFIINAILIRPYGIFGAILGTLIAQIMLFIFHFLISRYIIHEKFEYNITLFLPGILLIIVITIITYCLRSFWYIRWMLAFILGIYLLKDILIKKSIF